MNLSTAQQEILNYLQEIYPESATAADLSKTLIYSKTVIRAAAEGMAKQGIIKGRATGVNYTMRALEALQPSTPEKAILQPPEEAAQPPEKTPARPAKPRNKPFTPNPTRGYEVQKGRVKIYLDRKACSRVLTLSIDDLRELVRAAEKAS